MNTSTQRKLAAIVSADVVGYSRLMRADEAGTHERLQARFGELVSPSIKEHGGRIVKLMGDGLLAEFPSVVDAVRWSIEVQERNALHDADLPEDQRLTYRVGVNVGDVIVDGDDIFGDGVNIAARLEAMAPPGGLCISEKVYREVCGKVDAEFEDIGEQRAKNIDEPIHAWCWSTKSAPAPSKPQGTITAGPARHTKPSIAVLPFNNFSADPEQEFFADGIVEDLITALSRFPWLFVVARNSSFSYKGQSVNIKQVAEDLGVSYVVEGSVRSSSTRLRVSVQLIEAAHGHHVWAENYDRPVGDLFDLQDEITRSITGVLIPALSHAERERILRDNRPTLDAWHVYQKGLIHFYRPYSQEDNAEARKLFYEAIEIDPGFSDAHAMIALMAIYAVDSAQSSREASVPEHIAEAEKAAKTAVQCDDRNALAHLALGRVYGHLGMPDDGIAECRTAVEMNPNFAMAHHEFGFLLSFVDRYEEAIDCFDEAIRLSPNDPSRWNFYLLKGICLYAVGKHEEAMSSFREAARLRPTAFWPRTCMAAALAAMDRIEDAQVPLQEALDRNPQLSCSFFVDYMERLPYRPKYMQSWIADLKNAGLPVQAPQS